MGVWSAPGRVNLIGEHTDYNEGLALPFALDRTTLVAAAGRTDGQLRCWSQQVSDGDWQVYPRAVAAALADDGVATRGADLVVDSDVPAGAGLSSSAALEVAVALALLALADVRPDRRDIARICQRAENYYVGAPTGLLDPLAALFGAAGSAVLLDFRSLDVQQVPLPLPEHHVLVVDTGVVHRIADTGYADRRTTCERAAGLLGVPALRDVSFVDLEGLPPELRRRATHVVTENERVGRVAELLREGRTADIGPLLDASHTSLRDDFGVSCAELDVAVGSARAAGALGARMVGGGFGGSAIALVPKPAHDRVRRAVRDAFAERGWAEPASFVAAPGAGACRVL